LGGQATDSGSAVLESLATEIKNFIFVNLNIWFLAVPYITFKPASETSFAIRLVKAAKIITKSSKKCNAGTVQSLQFAAVP